MKTQTDEKVLEKNILIAKFWGYKYEQGVVWYNPFGLKEHYWIKNYDNSIQRLDDVNFRFDRDWNWLIPVIKKIVKLEANTSVLKSAKNKFMEDIKKEVLWDEIDKAIDCVVTFINVFNDEKYE